MTSCSCKRRFAGAFGLRSSQATSHQERTCTMKRSKMLAVAGLLIFGLMTSACGTVTGAAVGAGAGAAVGAGTGYGAGKGALIGTGGGAGAGATYDHTKD